MTDFKAVLDPAAQRCMAHPEQRLIETRQAGGRTLMTCPQCNTDVVDKLSNRPGTITIQVRSS